MCTLDYFVAINNVFAAYLTNTLCALKSLNPTDLTAYKLNGRRAVRLYEDRNVC